MVANHLRIKLEALTVEVTGDADLRGCLLVDKEVPVGFQKMRCRVHMKAAEGTEPRIIETLIKAAEHSCVVMQTLRSGVDVETKVEPA
jgi:uncharacterized OsmC-like protein